MFDMANRLTYRQISEQAKVSIMTVSNVLRGTRNVRAETQERVKSAIRELGGTLSLDEQNTNSPVVSHRPFRRLRLITRGTPKSMRDARVYHSLFQNLIMEAAEADYEIVCHNYDDVTDLEMNRFHDQTDAIFVMGQWADIEQPPKVPVISLMSTSTWFVHHHVGYQKEKVGALAARHLLRQGCRSMAYLGPDFVLRRQSFRDTIRTLSDAVYQDRVVADAYFFEDTMRINYPSVRQAVQNALKQAPDLDGIFTFDDTIAMAVKDSLHSLGYGNRNIALVGCNNDPGAVDILGNRSATIDLSLHEMARIAINRAIDCVKNPGQQGQTVLVEPKLVLARNHHD